MKKDKLKVNKELFEALNELLELRGDNVDSILNDHAECKYIKQVVKWRGGNWTSLNELSISEMATALYVGYELESSPEEKALNYYNELSDNQQHMVRIFLELVNIKFEGIYNEDFLE